MQLSPKIRESDAWLLRAALVEAKREVSSDPGNQSIKMALRHYAGLGNSQP